MPTQHVFYSEFLFFLFVFLKLQIAPLALQYFSNAYLKQTNWGTELKS